MNTPRIISTMYFKYWRISRYSGNYHPPPPPPPPPPPALPPPPLPEELPGGVDAAEMAEEKLFPISEVKFRGEKEATLPAPAYQAGW